jgi:diguanylate cyclase (GGDEF)-like protein/PAS domain S-box-containing protein
VPAFAHPGEAELRIGSILRTQTNNVPETNEKDVALQRAERLIAQFESTGKGWFWETDASGKLAYVSPTVSRTLGCEPTDIIGRNLTNIVSTDAEATEAGSQRTLGFYLSSRVPFNEVVVKANTKTDEVWWSITGQPIHDSVGRFLGFSGTASDLTEKRRSDVELNRLARFDSLTGLANRAMMQQTLEECLWSAVRRKHRCALFLLDLDRFKAVNDTLGHPAGDTLLRLVALRLKDVIGEHGQVGRLGGDEFKIVFPDFSSRDQLAELAGNVIESLSRPYYIEGHTVTIGASVGIVISDYDDRTATDLVRDGDLALYAAKGAGRGTFRFYSPEMHTFAQERQSLEADLRQALELGQLSMAYQPSINLATEKVSGFEALIRWHHPVRGSVSPAEFIPLAEEAGLINAIGEWVLRVACAEAAKWPSSTKVAVNLSPLQFANANLPSLIVNVLASSSLPASRLELEITEGVLLNDDSKVHEMIGSLKALGVKLALDDFGTGYSSLGYLRNVPFDKIKIDQSFVKGASISGNNNAPIIRAIVGLASDLNMETTAEGVETHDELELVRSLGCTQVQGYIFGKPMSPEEAFEFACHGLVAAPEGFVRARPERRRLIRKGSMMHGGKAVPVRLRNISSGGALLECSVQLEPGAQVELDVAVGQPRIADVRWVNDLKVGIQFREEFDMKSLAAVQGKAEGPSMLMPAYLASGGGADDNGTNRS